MSAQSIWTSARTAGSIQAAANAGKFWCGDYDNDLPEAKGSKSSWRMHHMPDSSDMFSAVEDVWLRLAASQDVNFTACWDRISQKHTVMFRSLLGEAESQTQDLLGVACSCALYTWQDGNQISRLCSIVEWVGDTLIIEIQSTRQLQRFTGGEKILNQMGSLLNRMSICIS